MNTKAKNYLLFRLSTLYGWIFAQNSGFSLSMIDRAKELLLADEAYWSV